MALINSRTVRGRCPTCGAEHAACGTASDTVPVDQRMEVAAVGGPLKKYEVTTPGTTLKLNEEDARRLGVLDEPKADTEEQAAEAEAPAKARTVRNKSRSASSNKDDG